MRMSAKTIASTAVMAAVVVACAGCAATAQGTVTGTFVMIGGPGPSGNGSPLPGRVIAASATGARFTVHTGNDGRYTMTLPPGTYSLLGYSPRVGSNNHEMRCSSPHPLKVRAHKATRGTRVICSIH